MNNKLKGLGVAVITPFLQNGEIAFETLAEHINTLINNGVDYLLALGTTSESPTLTDEEKGQVLRTMVNVVMGRVPIVLGLGGPSTQQIIKKMEMLDLSGIDAILSVTPYYNKPSQEGLYEHYKSLSFHSPLPIILYNVFHRTACNLEADTTLKLANDCKKIIGIKEASGNMNQIMRIIKHKPADFLVISGDDAITLPLLAVGADGLISVVANAYPKQYAEMIHLAKNENFKQAADIHNRFLDITQACFKEGNPAGIKAMMALQGKIDYYLRLPLTRISNELQHSYKALMEKVE
jgi:4-hydroxy-tetrahydrodipicolinate synthase